MVSRRFLFAFITLGASGAAVKRVTIERSDQIRDQIPIL